jgi:hypothetical protein
MTDRKGWTIPQLILAGAALVLTVGLMPLFFGALFTTVNTMLMPSLGWWAWAVPVATEAGFVILYLLDILLELRRKPMGWLKWAPYPFAAASLWLNVAAAHGDRTAMVGHAALVAAFFVPLIAAKAAVKSLSVSEEDVARRRALADARRYAIDVLRANLGWRWRATAPALMRRQVITGRLPHAVTAAVRESLASAYAEPWEPVLEKWVVDGLTTGAKVAAKVKAEKRAIEHANDAPPGARQPARHKSRQPASADRAKKYAEARRLRAERPELTLEQIGEMTGQSARSVSRAVGARPVAVRAAGG